METSRQKDIIKIKDIDTYCRKTLVSTQNKRRSVYEERKQHNSLMKPKVDFCFKELMEDEEVRNAFLAAAIWDQSGRRNR